MENLKRWFFSEQTQMYATLIFLMALIYWARTFMPVILLIIIFASLGISGGRWLERRLKIPYVIGVVSFYVLMIVGVMWVISLVAPMFYHEGYSLIQTSIKTVQDYPHLSKQFSGYLAQTNLDEKIANSVTTFLQMSLVAVQSVWKVVTEVAIAILLSLVYAVSLHPLKRFGKQFQHSDFPNFFKNVFALSNKFVYILGQIIRVQVEIDLINTTFSTIGFILLGMPSPLVLGSMVMVLGLIPVAGVLISLIPLTIVSFSTGGWVLALEMLIFILCIHAFEAYFLHPKLMASRSDLPIFVTFISLIVMERLLGPWGLILGVPIVSFALDVLNVHKFTHNAID
ncbi:AI-2E family transporter [Weissella kandleri]|uniref:AI-2E family transporter n=1 Tax=Weissella kandleri TaxID=1616 RepID=UPI00387E593C